MKRDPALQPLSRDHHQALAAALVLRRAGSAGDAEAAAERFLEFWRSHGRRHFQIEEEVLFAAWAAEAEAGGSSAGAYDQAMVERALADHHAVRTRARLIAAGDAAPEQLEELGEMIERHVRFEEREMFPAIEAALDGESLAALAVEIERAERDGGA